MGRGGAAGGFRHPTSAPANYAFRLSHSMHGMPQHARPSPPPRRPCAPVSGCGDASRQREVDTDPPARSPLSAATTHHRRGAHPVGTTPDGERRATTAGREKRACGSGCDDGRAGAWPRPLRAVWVGAPWVTSSRVAIPSPNQTQPPSSRVRWRRSLLGLVASRPLDLWQATSQPPGLRHVKAAGMGAHWVTSCRLVRILATSAAIASTLRSAWSVASRNTYSRPSCRL